MPWIFPRPALPTHDYVGDGLIDEGYPEEGYAQDSYVEEGVPGENYDVDGYGYTS